MVVANWQPKVLVWSVHYPVPGLPDRQQSKQTGNTIVYVLQEGKRSLYPRKSEQILFAQLQYHTEWVGIKVAPNTKQLACFGALILYNIGSAQHLPAQEAAGRKHSCNKVSG